MSNSIAVMNAKGGVGKSTLVLALAETLSAYHDKRVLVIDSDAQASVSSMFMTIANLHRLQSEQATLVDYLVAGTLRNLDVDWRNYIVEDVSDVDDARSVYLIPSDMQLTLFEREVSKESLHSRLRMVISQLVHQVSQVFDCVLIDCSPGLSVLTECWLRETAYHVAPTKADYVSICGLEVFRRFQSLNPEMGFAENLGVIVNMRDAQSKTETDYQAWLKSNDANRCFKQAIPRVCALQDAARFDAQQRSYFAKYPGKVGEALRALTVELVDRLDTSQSYRMHARAAAEAQAASSIDAA
ncbi:MAG: ParA family protein [Alphaproteobacteria bacterium]|nr:ParA family protein [Alphaproteobacteria bacterium]